MSVEPLVDSVLELQVRVAQIAAERDTAIAERDATQKEIEALVRQPVDETPAVADFMRAYAGFLSVAAAMARGDLLVEVDTSSWPHSRVLAHNKAMIRMQERAADKAVRLRDLANEARGAFNALRVLRKRESST